jgi:hypothetical protein
MARSKVAKVVELIGSSPKSFEDAAQVAIQRAARTIRGITGAKVEGMSAKIENGKVVEYRATVKLAFAVEE